jgi:hypothetical protein
MNIEHDVPLGRLTTVGIGGPAQHFARPQTVADLEEALRWAAVEGLDVFTIGLGSNVLVADEGVDALVLRLEGQLALAETKDGLLVAGGGAANAVCLHRTRAAGLGGRSSRARSPARSAGRAHERGCLRGRLRRILARPRRIGRRFGLRRPTLVRAPALRALRPRRRGPAEFRSSRSRPTRWGDRPTSRRNERQPS